jgi:hypothetical protein
MRKLVNVAVGRVEDGRGSLGPFGRRPVSHPRSSVGSRAGAPVWPGGSLHALRLDGLEGDPVYSRCPIVAFGHLIRSAQGLHLADVDV